MPLSKEPKPNQTSFYTCICNDNPVNIFISATCLSVLTQRINQFAVILDTEAAKFLL